MSLILQTPRLYLRRFTTDDAHLLLQLNSDPEVLKYLHEPALQDEAHATEILKNIILPQYEKNLGRWATYITNSEEFIGWCGLKYHMDTGEIDLGYRFMKKHWGKGYATEAAQHTLNYGLQELLLKEITACAHVENLASLKVLEKIGMRYVSESIIDDCPVKTYIATP
ncbi:MAG: GNAT family N-acetyltransferase [Bacteroidetes bacterium]|jgi:RimJ/RimL family protein N-acetyltransferase|nr:GNAT family N-acetyltransferase [Bacteroidota bacterium]